MSGVPRFRSSCSAALVALMCTLMINRAQFATAKVADGVVRLRSSRVQLRPASSLPSEQPSGSGGAAPQSQGGASSTLVAGDYESDSSIGADSSGALADDTTRSRQYLVQLRDPDGCDKFRKYVEPRGCSVSYYIQDFTLLVYGPYNVVRDAAIRLKAFMGDYSTDSKISPEADKMRQAMESVIKRRRRLGQLGLTSSSDAAGHQGGTEQEEEVLPAILRSLQTWSPDGGLAGPEVTDRRSLLDGTGTLYGISVLIIPGLPNDTVRTTVWTGWVTALTEHLNRTGAGSSSGYDACRPRADDVALYHDFTPRLQLFLCAQDTNAALNWLSRQALAVWIEPELRVVSRNAAGGWTVQTGDLDLNRFNNLTSELRPYWKAGIMGNGTVVGVGDTGLDMGHCSFVDDAFDPETLRSKLNGSPSKWFVPEHRKVIQYAVTNRASGVTKQRG